MTNNNDGIDKTMDDFIHSLSISMRKLDNGFLENILNDEEKKKKPKKTKIPTEKRREWFRQSLL